MSAAANDVTRLLRRVREMRGSVLKVAGQAREVLRNHAVCRQGEALHLGDFIKDLEEIAAELGGTWLPAIKAEADKQ